MGVGLWLGLEVLLRLELLCFGVLHLGILQVGTGVALWLLEEISTLCHLCIKLLFKDSFTEVAAAAAAEVGTEVDTEVDTELDCHPRRLPRRAFNSPSLMGIAGTLTFTRC